MFSVIIYAIMKFMTFTHIRTAKLIVVLLLITTFSQAQQAFYIALADSANTLLKWPVVYTRDYFEIPYPNGDIPKNVGCCTDVVIRTYRKFGIDLQKEVHEDMVANFNKYPKLWNPTVINPSIDHRRVTILNKFFSRKGQTLKLSDNATDYKPGDIVIWYLGAGTYHIGIILNNKSKNTGNPLIMHNIGAGHQVEDCLFDWKITGHYRYPSKS